MLSLTFLQARLGRLCKTVRPDGVEPYPMAAQFKSHVEAIATPQQMLDALRQHAAAGHCLHVGNLTQPLTDWGRRAGMADRSSALQWVVIDVDKFDLGSLPQQWDTAALQQTADAVVQRLGDPILAETTYIAQAATKLGLNGSYASLHLFFLLRTPTRSHELKDWLKRLNYRSEETRRRIRLSANGFALCYPIDVSCADVGRLIYLAPPIFTGGVTDPFSSPAERFVLAQKRNDTLDIAADELAIGAQLTNLDGIERKLKRDLRAAAGLNPTERERLKNVTINGRTVELLVNPAQGVLRPASRGRGFCYYNLNDGDSGAYFHEEGRPDVIHNFKGEPSFRWADVDPNGYEQYCNDNAALIAKADPINVFMVVNQGDDKLYKVWHDHANDSVTLVPSSRPQIEDFYAEYGKVVPVFVPTWRIEFAPDSNTRVDYVSKTINQFNPTIYMRQTEHQLGNVADMLKIGSNELWKTLCPAIGLLIEHVSGNASPEEQDLFINWLSFIWQKRRKAQTAWIFQGNEGTGKGTLFDEVLRPLFGPQHTIMQHTNVLNDNFDAWRARMLLVVIDEFEMPATNSADQTLARLRNWITEESGGVRAMFKMAEDQPLFENYIMFSNKHNILRIPEGDRRYNIFPRQEKRLNTVCDTEELYSKLGEELELFATILHHWQVDTARAMTAFTSDAKLAARAAAYTTSDEFALAMKHGDIDFFAQVFDVTPNMHALGENQLARAAMSRAILSVGDPCFLTGTEMTAVYNVMNESRMNPMHFGKMISRHGIETARGRTPDGRRQRGYTITFRADTQVVESLQAYVRRGTEGNQFQVVEGGRA